MRTKIRLLTRLDELDVALDICSDVRRLSRASWQISELFSDEARQSAITRGTWSPGYHTK